ncbi:hypothetical protein CAPTEDRAFT_205484 [Capitella teleta]|uniref:Uncharacterized protein n=1 Tax=Capitella teleta TaxID=283909 RepID=R7UGT5_CAPTE|nr:hypothetical protein CAPTEDRAFT_205484 [Capitella teleta]|eukprot:ELU05430.1 hypothetical protein CAPTEDRAFT_205484 [Capitella teleta]
MKIYSTTTIAPERVTYMEGCRVCNKCYRLGGFPEEIAKCFKHYVNDYKVLLLESYCLQQVIILAVWSVFLISTEVNAKSTIAPERVTYMEGCRVCNKCYRLGGFPEEIAKCFKHCEHGDEEEAYDQCAAETSLD